MKPTKILWTRLGGIVAVQGAITLAWVIYALYLPDLLIQLGFYPELAKLLLIIENALEAFIEPIFGHFSDQSQRKIGTRLPWINLGVLLASGLFIILPIMVFFLPTINPWRWTFPILVVFWASAMAIFRSPLIALLGETASQTELPIAASFLTFIQQLISSFRFIAYSFILSFGSIFTFAIGSFVLLGAAAFLRQVTPPSIPTKLSSTTLSSIPTKILIFILGTGFSIGFSLRFIFASLSQIFASQLLKNQVSLGMLGFNILIAISAILIGKISSKIGNTKTMLAGLLTTAIILKIIPLITSNTILIIGIVLMSFFFSAVLNGMFPLVLGLISKERLGLGVGVFFGGFGAAISFFMLLFSQISTLEVQTSLGAFFLFVASLCVISTHYFKQKSKTI